MLKHKFGLTLQKIVNTWKLLNTMILLSVMMKLVK